MQIPFKRTHNTAFKNRDDVVLVDVFPVKDGEHITLVFESTNSPWRQGVWLTCDRGVEINNQVLKSALLWKDTAPREVDIKCLTSNGLLAAYNVWDRGDGRDSLSHSSGMLVEELPAGRRYKCNDIGFRTDFDKIIFRIEHSRE
jgi:hypothetical protein